MRVYDIILSMRLYGLDYDALSLRSMMVKVYVACHSYTLICKVLKVSAYYNTMVALHFDVIGII